MKTNLLRGAALAAVLVLAGVAVAQRPVEDIDAHRHPHLAAAQQTQAQPAAAPCNFTPIKDLRPIYQNFKSGLDPAPLVAHLASPPASASSNASTLASDGRG